VQLNLVRVPGIRTPPQAEAVLVALARRLSPAGLRVQLVLAGDAGLRRLNREYRGRDRTTDVLSFLYAAPGEGAPGRRRRSLAPDAELYISMPRARAQARERRHPLRCELVLLALHGMLHLQGHDHHRPGDARRMRAAEVPQLRWLARRTGWRRLEPLVPSSGRDEETP